MWWNGDNMEKCRTMLVESGREIMNLAQECMQESENTAIFRNDRRLLVELSDILVRTARFEILLSEGIERINKIYEANEESIVDYFDLTKQVPPHIEVGVSRFDSLKSHEDQMPFAQ